MKNSIRIFIAILVITSMLLPRMADLVKFTAADEPFWLVVGANYYYALTHGELENTVYEYHPAVTTMWVNGDCNTINSRYFSTINANTAKTNDEYPSGIKLMLS